MVYIVVITEPPIRPAHACWPALSNLLDSSGVYAGLSGASMCNLSRAEWLSDVCHTTAAGIAQRGLASVPGPSGLDMVLVVNVACCCAQQCKTSVVSVSSGVPFVWSEI